MSNTTIAQKLQLVLDNKNAIKSSLIAKGITVGDKMSEWSDAIDNAPMGGVEPIRATFAGSNNSIKIFNSSYWYDYGISKILANDEEVKTTTLPANVDGYDVEYYTLKLPTHALYSCYGLTSITIPNSVTSIGDYAFLNCYGLTSITIPNSVTSIGDATFLGCDGLTSITIPNSVTSIGSMAFSGCRDLTSLKVEEGNPKYDSRDNCNAIIESSTNTLIAGCKTTTIPNSVTSIGDDAFYGIGLTSITIPNSVTSIGESAFSNSALTSIDIPNSVTSIGDATFLGCDGLTSITIPNSVTSIGEYVFYHCSSITAIYSDGLQVKLDVSDSRQQFDAESIQSVIDTWHEGGAIMFSNESALDLKGNLILGDKAHWEGDTLVYGPGGGYYYYY